MPGAGLPSRELRSHPTPTGSSPLPECPDVSRTPEDADDVVEEGSRGQHREDGT